MEITDLSKVADKNKFNIAAPQTISLWWNVNPSSIAGGVNYEVEFVKDLIREISSKVAKDQKRIYATGYSGGARMSSRLACELSNVIAAIGPVAGLRCPEDCAPTHSVSIITFHGTADRTNPYFTAEDSVPCWVEKNGCNKTQMTRKNRRM